MNDEIHAYLDGDRTFEELSPQSREEAGRWRAWLAEARADPASAPPWLERRIMARVEAGRARRLVAVLEELLRPRTFRASPLGLAAAAVALVALLAIPWLAGVPGAGPEAGVLYVQFSLEAPGARTVAIAGDFTGWDTRFPLGDPDGDGIWTGRVALEPGVHQYMFVVDGSRWVTDPRAERYAEDGFGNRNAVVAVASLGGV